MNAQLESFLKTLYERPDARTPIKELYHRFRVGLSPRELRTWPRWRFVEEISKLFPTGTDSDKVVYVGGVSLDPPRRYVRTEDGRLRLQVA